MGASARFVFSTCAPAYVSSFYIMYVIFFSPYEYIFMYHIYRYTVRRGELFYVCVDSYVQKNRVHECICVCVHVCVYIHIYIYMYVCCMYV